MSTKSNRFGRRTVVNAPLALAIALCLILSMPVETLADGDETLGAPSVAIAMGTGFVGAGVGLRGTTSGTININVPGNVAQALLYWTGEALTPSLGDDAVDVDTIPVVGTLIGTSLSPDGTRTEATYRADITGQVMSGANSLLIEDVSFNNKNYGAGLLVIYDDGGSPLPTIEVLDGLDHAFTGQPEPRLSTILQTVTFPVAGVDRTAEIIMMFADATADRPDEIEITVGAAITLLVNAMASTDGLQWDTITTNVNIPAGETQLSVQAFSRDTTGFGGVPDSMLWNLLAVLVPEDGDDGGEGCTPGFWKQTQHLGSWPINPSTQFSAVFDNAFPGLTLLQVVNLNGGRLIRLGAHTVAAYLNALSPSVDYDLSPAEVVQLFNDVFPGSNSQYNAVKNIFAAENELTAPTFCD